MIHTQDPPDTCVPRSDVNGMFTSPMPGMTRAEWNAPTSAASGRGSVVPTIAALASPRRIASRPHLSATPNVEQAPTGAQAAPCTLSSIVICAAAAFWMFQIRFGLTAVQGGGGQPISSTRARCARTRLRMALRCAFS